MTTRRIIIKSQYLRICKQIDSKIEKVVLKSIEEYDFIDLITPFNYYFINTTDENYEEKIDYILTLQDIELTQDELEIVYPIIYNDFIKWYKTLQ